MRPIDADKLHKDIYNGPGTDLQKFFAACCVAAAPTINPYEWIGVEDERRQPPVREEVIVVVCDDSGDSPFRYTTSGWLTARNGMWIVDNDVCPYVTHWMPLPTPPTDKEN